MSQQASDKRLLTFPPVLFEQVFEQIRWVMKPQWQARETRPLPASIGFSQRHFGQIWVVDGSTLKTLLRKLKSCKIPRFA